MPWNFAPLVVMMAVGLPPVSDARYPGASEIYHCTFDNSFDTDFDGWPDRWTRRRGPGFPHYVSIKISEEAPSSGGRSLRIDLNGGGAAAYSPPMAVPRLAGFVLEGFMKTEGLKHDGAYFSLTLFDKDRQRLETFTSQKIQAAHDWQKVRLGPFVPGNSTACSAVVGLHVEPLSAEEDFKGSVLFADIWLGRLPKMVVESTDPHNFFTDPQAVEIRCTVAGIATEQSPPADSAAPQNSPDPQADNQEEARAAHEPYRLGAEEVAFQLEDALGHPLAETRQTLTYRRMTRDGDAAQAAGGEPPTVSATAAWKPPLAGAGFYRVRTSLLSGGQPSHQQELTLAVVEPWEPIAGNPFGWTLPQGDKPLALPALERLLAQAGVGWVKYPFWYDESAKAAAVDELAAMADQLAQQGIQPVGLLSVPPPSLRAKLGSAATLSAAEVFALPPQDWGPSIELVMTRLGTQIRWWQLGDDKDTSFVGYPNLPAKIAQVKAALDRIGQDVAVGLGWNWLSPPPQAGENCPWRFLSLWAKPPAAAAELVAHLQDPTIANMRRWVVVEPLPRSQAVAARAADLVKRMMAVTIHGANAAFCPDPFDADCGLMNPDGTPGELLLPWRTAAFMLGNAKPMGSLELPGGSPNYVFSRGREAVMAVWNDRPCEEVFALGEQVQQIDLWGHRIKPATIDGRQVLQVDQLPTFVTGLSEPLARWQIDCSLAHDHIPSIFGRPHENAFRVSNPFPGAIGGRATLVAPEVWNVSPKQIDFRLAPGEQLQQPFSITLPFNADSGRQDVRIDFEIRQAQRVDRFSVHRAIEVGLDDVSIEISTRLSEQGNLEVVQRFINASDSRVSFSCELYAPQRRRQTTQIVKLGRAQDVQIYRLPDGKELLGKTLWLRAGERDGPRTLNYRFVAKQ